MVLSASIQNLEHIGFIKIAATYMNYFENLDIGKKTQNLKGRIFSNQQTISQHHLSLEYLELSSIMKTKGGARYLVSAISYIRYLTQSSSPKSFLRWQQSHWRKILCAQEWINVNRILSLSLRLYKSKNVSHTCQI